MALSSELQQALDRLREIYGKPLPQITSGYRDPVKNADVGGAKKSQHLHGNALDWATASMSPDERLAFLSAARQAGFSGFGGYASGNVHTDVGGARIWGDDYTSKSAPDWLRSFFSGSAPSVSSKGNIPMDQQKPDQERRGGLMGLFDMAMQRNPETGLTAFEGLGAALDPLIMPEMRAGEAIRARGAQRVQRSQMNKTIEWMKNNGYGEIAAMVEQNPVLASNVMSAILSKKLETPAKPKIYSVGDKLVDETGKVIFGGDTSRYSKEQLSAMNALRDDLRKDTEKFNLLKQGWDNIQTFYSNPGGVSDYALAVGFAKILDPGSVAREGEVAAVANSGSLGGALKSQILNALQGEGKLPPAVRQQIAQLSRQLYSNQIPEAQSVLQNYGRIAERAGLTMEDIYSGPTFKMPEEIKPAVIPMPSNWPSGQAAWDALSEQEKQEFING